MKYLTNKLFWSNIIWGNIELCKVKDFKLRHHVTFTIFICTVNFQRGALDQNDFQN